VPFSRVVVGVCVAFSTLAACAQSDDASPPARAQPPGEPSTARQPRSPANPTAAPRPGQLRTPATSAGPLTRKDFPRPATLGPGWAYAVDPGSPHEGYLGNGTPALARDPLEVTQASVPLGCSRPVRFPVPAHALEVDYSYRGDPVVAVRLRFPSPGSSARFQAARTTALTACRGRTGGHAVGPLVGDVTVLAPDAVLSRRTPASDPWSEVVVRAGTDVALVAVRGTTASRADALAVAAAFRRPRG
jgi:hypothetical protein